ncbi:MAG: hypothetical protein ACPGRC_01310 [Salibacteraceae bacterium]
MDITLHEESYGQKSLKKEVVAAFKELSAKPSRDTIKNIMAYSRALSVSDYESLGKQELNLN